MMRKSIILIHERSNNRPVIITTFLCLSLLSDATTLQIKKPIIFNDQNSNTTFTCYRFLPMFKHITLGAYHECSDHYF
jgi:hypothetical protein